MLETLEHEAIDLVADAVFPLHRRPLGANWRHEGPMRAPGSTGFDPVAKNRYVTVRELVMPEVGRGHAPGFVVASYSPEDLGCCGSSLIFEIEPQVRLPVCGIRPVACIAIVGKERPYISIEIDRECRKSN